ncbi:MAG: cell division protein FtsZ [Proteobacteria bacterium]|nr:cell division protein FtsZ [Pseudomonadota bacterium]
MPKTNLVQDELELRPRISVIGVGGAGGNAVNNMIRAKLEGVEFLIANTDAQALTQSLVPKERRIQLGLSVTQGLGAGSKPDVGRASAEESIEEILDLIKGSNMLFITAGMGGGTGSGAAPVIARAAREMGILTVGVVTKPFNFEGAHRSRTAEGATDELQQYVDTLIIIPNQNLFRLANERTTFADAFKMADDVLYSGVRGVTDLMIMPGLINLDFADIRAVMAEMGKAMMGTGEAEGERRALDAAEAAISNPLLDDVSMKGARGVLINITGGYDMTLYEVDEAANRIREDVDSDANIIFGSTFDERLNGRMRVSVVATGIGAVPAGAYSNQQRPAVAAQASDAIGIARPVTSNNMFSTFSGFNSSATQTPTTTFAETIRDTTIPSDQREEDNQEFQNIHEMSTEEEFIELSDEPATEGFDHVEPIQSIEQPAEKKKGPSLFERFTGVSRKTSQSAPVIETNFQQQSNQKKDDLIDIPAFLRRGG